eukprot:600846-Prymnesium_polylepis.1
MGKYEASAIAKKRKGRAARAKATDFERFEIMLARKERAAARKAAITGRGSAFGSRGTIGRRARVTSSVQQRVGAT